MSVLGRAARWRRASWSMAKRITSATGLLRFRWLDLFQHRWLGLPSLRSCAASTLKVGFAGQFYAPKEWNRCSTQSILQWQANGAEIEIHVTQLRC